MYDGRRVDICDGRMLDNSEDKPAVTVGMNDTGITGVEPDDGCRVLPRPEL